MTCGPRFKNDITRSENPGWPMIDRAVVVAGVISSSMNGAYNHRHSAHRRKKRHVLPHSIEERKVSGKLNRSNVNHAWNDTGHEWPIQG
uniref:Uncharacterized protein n=1 Tax=Bursaphelenchus xylophilus TaxID=6326 RepID=A0A1I7SCF2_BURXY